MMDEISKATVDPYDVNFVRACLHAYSASCPDGQSWLPVSQVPEAMRRGPVCEGRVRWRVCDAHAPVTGLPDCSFPLPRLYRAYLFGAYHLFDRVTGSCDGRSVGLRLPRKPSDNPYSELVQLTERVAPLLKRGCWPIAQVIDSTQVFCLDLRNVRPDGSCAVVAISPEEPKAVPCYDSFHDLLLDCFQHPPHQDNRRWYPLMH